MLVAFRQGWIESAQHTWFMERVALTYDAPHFGGLLLFGVMRWVEPDQRMRIEPVAAASSVVNRTFDFEALCRRERPELIFRPHWTQQHLNEALSQSRCLAAEYVAVTTLQASSCPLYVRNDLVEAFRACLSPQPAPR